MIRRRMIAVLFVLGGLLVAAWAAGFSFWILPPERKFAYSWKQDLDLLRRERRMPHAWRELSQVELSTSDPVIESWYKKTPSPFEIQRNGRYKLEILAIHVMENFRYGVVLQYNWIDIKTGNTVGELARTLWLGLVY